MYFWSLGVGEYTTKEACGDFCGLDSEKSKLMLIIIILVAIGIFVAFVMFALHLYGKSKSRQSRTFADLKINKSKNIIVTH